MAKHACPTCAQLRARVSELEAQLAHALAHLHETQQSTATLQHANEQLQQTNQHLQQANGHLQQAAGELQKANEHLTELNDAQQKKTDQLDRKVRQLQPPQPPDIPKPEPRPKSTKKQGAQPGHQPHQHELLPPNRVTKTIVHRPKQCEECGHKLPIESGPNDPEPRRHQILELPELNINVTEHQGHSRICPCCQHLNYEPIPEVDRKYSLGPNLVGFMSLLVVGYKVSRRGVQELLHLLLDVKVSLGTVSNYEAEMSKALEKPYQEALDAARADDAKNIDESTWSEKGCKRWLWVMATTMVVVFAIRSLRSWAVAAWMLGSATLKGIVTSDRLKIYDNIPILMRQLCWAHLRRNIEKFAKRSKKAAQIAELLLEIHRQVFHEWHLFRGGTITRSELDERICPIMLEMLEILQHGSRSRDGATLRFCQGLLKHFVGLWTFVVVEGVEPTNNHGERVHRHAVIWRKCCQGSQSGRGCEYTERMLTVVQTLRLQKRPILEFLSASVASLRSGSEGPKLVA